MKLPVLALIALTSTTACSGASPSAARDIVPAPSADAGPGASADAGPGASADAAPEACVPAPASSEQVTLQNDYGTLGGVLEIPAGCLPMPVVLVLSGSGSTDRDGNAPGSPDRTDTYKMLAQALRAQAHVATMRYDDHGVGASVTGAPASVQDFRFDTEVKDAGRWVEKLRKDTRFSEIVVAGHSQGSLTAILASRAAPIDAFISLDGAGKPAGAVLHDQAAPHLTAAQLAELDDAIAKLDAGQLAGQLPSPLDQVLPLDEQPYLISWFKYDPAQEIAKFKPPTLLVQGNADIQVSVEDAQLLQQGKPDATLALIDNMSHPLKQATLAPADQQAAYSDPGVPLAKGLMAPIVKFLHTVEQAQ